MIGEIANVLAQAEINIDDIEILRVREGEGGSIRLGFAKQGAANQAVAVLTQRGIQARTID
jgi:prephenate dehydrogenase